MKLHIYDVLLLSLVRRFRTQGQPRTQFNMTNRQIKTIPFPRTEHWTAICTSRVINVNRPPACVITDLEFTPLLPFQNCHVTAAFLLEGDASKTVSSCYCVSIWIALTHYSWYGTGEEGQTDQASSSHSVERWNAEARVDRSVRSQLY
jgi:hypothetical protein